jgi:hypothetical protein
VELDACDHSAGQTVTPPAGGTVRLLGACLDAAGGGTANGTPVQEFTCNGTGAQNWALQSNGELVNPVSGRCLTAPNGTAGVALQLADCTASAGQLWRFPPNRITGPASLCADVADADPASGTATRLWGCNDSDAQRWSAPGDATLRALGKCLDVTHGATANNTPVQLWDCNGSGSQQWVTQADRSLRNPASGRCLDDPNNAGTQGDPLQIFDCNGSAAQRFTLGG